MKVLKIIFNTILIIIFVVSISFNLTMFESSYSTLLFKYDQTKFLSMNTYSDFNASIILQGYRINSAIQIETNAVDECSTYIAKFHTNDEFETNYFASCEDETNKKTTDYYYKDDTLYTINNKEVQKETIVYDDFITSNNLIEVINNYLLKSQTIQTNKNIKTKIHFSFSPFYFIGIEYAYKNDKDTSFSYKYDMRGRIRKISVKDKEGKEKYFVFNYKNNTINFEKLDELLEA